MRILHTSDWHLGKNLETSSRMQEQEEFLEDFIDIVEENNIDIVIIAGDIYDTGNPPARAEKMFYDTLKNISKNGQRLTLVVAGNHDNPERIVASAPLAMDHGIIMVGTPKTVVPVGNYGKHKVLNSGEGFIEVEINNEKAVILTVAYPSEKRLNEVLYSEMESDKDKLKSYSDRIYHLFDNLKKNYREDTINLVVSHLYTNGSVEGGSERSIQLGGSFIVNGDCFPKEAQYIALGHVHKYQIVKGTEKRARYSGSPIQYSKDERHNTNMCIIVDVHPKEQCTTKEIPLKVYKPIEVWECDSIESAIQKCEKDKEKDCWVYLEITTDRYIREDEIKRMKELKRDILEIKPKIIGNDEEDIKTESMSQKSFEELFKEFYKKERNLEVQQEVVDMLLSILEECDIDETN